MKAYESPTDADLQVQGRTREELKAIYEQKPWDIYAAFDAMTDAEYEKFAKSLEKMRGEE